MSQERRKILAMVENGRITPEEAAHLLELLPENSSPDPESAPVERSASETPTDDEGEWVRRRLYWAYLLAAGVIVMLVGGAVLTATSTRGRASLGTWLCGWLPLFLGLSIATVAAWSRTARWVLLRVRDRESALSLGFPLPLRFSAAVLGVARRLIPRLRETRIDEAILSLRDGLEDDQPIIITVDDEEEGEHVQIYIA